MDAMWRFWWMVTSFTSLRRDEIWIVICHTRRDNLTVDDCRAKMCVIIIKLADRLHNMRTLQFMSRKAEENLPEKQLRLCAAGRPLKYGTSSRSIGGLSFRYLMPKAFKKPKFDGQSVEKSQRN